MIVNLFSGADGWGEGGRCLGLSPIGFDTDLDACRTARAAGHVAVCQDVTTIDPARFHGRLVGLIASPPCPDFSKAGKRRGLDGETGRLIFEIPRWVASAMPEWIACEQVPEVLPYWHRFAKGFRAIGYSVWCGLLDAADYGTPQNRTRAILLASLDREVRPPEPSHSRTGHAEMFGSRERWVSMADALGWNDCPWAVMETVVSTPRAMHRPAPAVALGHNAASWRTNTRHGGSPMFDPAERPARTITDSAARGSWVLRTGANSEQVDGLERYEREVDRPAPVVDTKAGRTWHLNTRRDQREDGSTQTRSLDAPAPALTAKASGQWIYERPATTVMGDQRIFPPTGHHPYQGLGSWSARSIAVTIPELGILQGFPRDYPWQGNKTSQARQVGNAIPVQLARAILEAIA